jgi:CheY-like chemotaxis protein
MGRSAAREGLVSLVLVVEDDPGVTGLLDTMLQLEGYAVRTTVNGLAPALAVALQPDLILLDIMMPGMDGIEVARRLRADPATRAIPIVLMSAADRLRERAHEVAVDEVLPKPFDVEHALAVVERLIGGTGAPPPTG